MKRQLYLASYDISDPKRLQSILSVVKAYATGGQKSVFECWLTAAEKRDLMSDIGDRMASADDRFFLLRLDERSRFRVLGLGVVPADPAFFYHG